MDGEFSFVAKDDDLVSSLDHMESPSSGLVDKLGHRREPLDVPEGTADHASDLGLLGIEHLL